MTGPQCGRNARSWGERYSNMLSEALSCNPAGLIWRSQLISGQMRQSASCIFLPYWPKDPGFLCDLQLYEQPCILLEISRRVYRECETSHLRDLEFRSGCRGRLHNATTSPRTNTIWPILHASSDSSDV